MRVVIHHQGDMPFPEDEGITLSPGQASSIGIRQVSTAMQSQNTVSASFTSKKILRFGLALQIIIYMVYSTTCSTVHYRPLNSLEHCICTVTMTNIRPDRDSNPVLQGFKPQSIRMSHRGRQHHSGVKLRARSSYTLVIYTDITVNHVNSSIVATSCMCSSPS